MICIIYGNGANVTGGEHDLEIDTYKYSRDTGLQNEAGEFLAKDITVTVKNLNGIASWGQRNTNHKITLNFENCKNMNRIYFSGTAGDIVLMLMDVALILLNGGIKIHLFIVMRMVQSM